ncbi:MAG: YjjG family noncanonical pyrimidine nucleotidase [Planctomycetota bacterium]
MKYPILFFDADNTLLDYDRAREHCLGSVITELHGSFDPSWVKVYVDVSVVHWRLYESGQKNVAELKHDRFRDFLFEIGSTLDPMEVNNRYIAALKRCTILVSEAVETLERLDEKNYRMFMVTNNFAEIQRPRFDQSDVGRFFEDYIIADEVGATKPAPEIYDAAMGKCGQVDKADVLMIGDSLHNDVTGAIDFGINACWFNPAGAESVSETRSFYSIQRLSQLLTVV